MWKKGQTGNPLGRPKGKTLKEWCREFLAKMTDEERDIFMEGIPKEVVWKMAEGNPANELQGENGTPLLVMPVQLIEKNATTPSPGHNSK